LHFTATEQTFPQSDLTFRSFLRYNFLKLIAYLSAALKTQRSMAAKICD